MNPWSGGERCLDVALQPHWAAHWWDTVTQLGNCCTPVEFPTLYSTHPYICTQLHSPLSLLEFWWQQAIGPVISLFTCSFKLTVSSKDFEMIKAKRMIFKNGWKPTWNLTFGAITAICYEIIGFFFWLLVLEGFKTLFCILRTKLFWLKLSTKCISDAETKSDGEAFCF